MRSQALVGATLALLVACVVSAEIAPAQEGTVTLDFRGGGTVPAGELSDLLKTSASFGVGINVPLIDGVDVRAQGGADLYRGRPIVSGVGSGRDVADLTLTHLRLGPSVDLLGSESGAFGVDVYALGGITAASSDRQDYGTGDGGIVRVDLATVWPLATGGARIGYRVNPRVNVFVSGEVNYIFADRAETAEYTRLGPIGAPDGFGAQASFPVSVGVELLFPE